MSWGGFKKVLNRQASQILVKSEDKVTDYEFEYYERAYKELDKIGYRLAKESQGYLSSLLLLSRSQLSIAESITKLFQEEGSQSGIRENNLRFRDEYLSRIRDFDGETMKEVEHEYKTTVLEPMERFSEYFENVQQAVKKRQHKRMDYENCKSRARRVGGGNPSSSSLNVSKIGRVERELQLAREVYEGLNEELKVGMAELVNLRQPYMEPSFEAMMKVQKKVSLGAYVALAQTQNLVSAVDRDGFANGTLDARMDNALAEMLRLTTVQCVYSGQRAL
ncbi:BAR-domain-containing protein [Ascoidea rubescens DSM 1968]|uniref:BAR-domain-containing protein n=1 Tax=Ascoidea rubescens DSM 1968 TaxID=1344418 RepID=A0A1D2VQX7_9ASCO|nr:BAR-domain-containing protein [Ascoidea rubescens DSM 1968]ODV63967.1 BAR-domain-containing protein [Ascoidea rubescens DSM 1968]